MADLLHYTFKVTWSDGDAEYVATCEEIPGLSGLGSTEAAAIAELKVAIGGWLDHLTEQGLPHPQPLR